MCIRDRYELVHSGSLRADLRRGIKLHANIAGVIQPWLSQLLKINARISNMISGALRRASEVKHVQCTNIRLFGLHRAGSQFYNIISDFAYLIHRTS